jgi:hypothetical protein
MSFPATGFPGEEKTAALAVLSLVSSYADNGCSARDEFGDQVRHDRQTRGSIRERHHRGARRTDRECPERVVVALMKESAASDSRPQPSPSNGGAWGLDLRLQVRLLSMGRWTTL